MSDKEKTPYLGPEKRTYIDIKGPMLMGHQIVTKEDGTKWMYAVYSSEHPDNDYTLLPYVENKEERDE